MWMSKHLEDADVMELLFFGNESVNLHIFSEISNLTWHWNFSHKCWNPKISIQVLKFSFEKDVTVRVYVFHHMIKLWFLNISNNPYHYSEAVVKSYFLLLCVIMRPSIALLGNGPLRVHLKRFPKHGVGQGIVYKLG